MPWNFGQICTSSFMVALLPGHIGKVTKARPLVPSGYAAPEQRLVWG